MAKRRWEDPNYRDTHDIFDLVNEMFGPHPEASTRPKNMGGSGTTRKKAARAYYKKRTAKE